LGGVPREEKRKGGDFSSLFRARERGRGEKKRENAGDIAERGGKRNETASFDPGRERKRKKGEVDWGGKKGTGEPSFRF